MTKKLIPLLILIPVLIGCAFGNNSKKLIEGAITAHGGKQYEKLQVRFDFRGRTISIYQSKDSFNYSLTFRDSSSQNIVDAVSNQGFQRTVNGQLVVLEDSLVMKYKEATNSIAYFVLLPYKLSEPAVQSEYIGEIVIDQQLYKKVKVSFKQEGGGTDFGDVFCYWFNANTKMLDYLAYSNGGPRFRKATKRTSAKGVIFQDYDNYVVLDSSLPSSLYDSAFIKQQVKLLSKIEQTDYK